MKRMHHHAPVLVLLVGISVLGSLRLGAQGALRQMMVYEQSWRGTKGQETRWPVAVAAASDAELAVADARGARLLVFHKTGVSWSLFKSIPLAGVPVSLARAGNRYLLSLRQGQGLVAVEGADLLLRKIALPKGVVPGPLAATKGSIYLYDYAGGKILVLSGSGDKVVRWIDVGGDVDALAVGLGGDLFVARPAAAAISKLGSGGGLEATWPLPPSAAVPAWPSGIAVAPGGEVLVADRHTGRILVLDAAGRAVGQGSRGGFDPGLLRFPAGLALLPDGSVAVADEGNGRIQIFHLIQPGQGR